MPILPESAWTGRAPERGCYGRTMERIERAGAWMTGERDVALSLFSFIRGRRSRLSRDEARVLKLVEFASETIARDLFEAENRDDLHERIDLITESPKTHGVFALLQLEPMLRVGPKSTKFGDSYGRGAAKKLEEGSRLLFALTSTLTHLRAATDAEVSSVAATVADPLGFLSDPQIHPRVAKAMLSGLHANVCLLGMAAVALASKKPEPWLRAALVDEWVANLRKYVALVASMPGIVISQELIPAADRFDPDKVNEAVRAANERYALALRRARESNLSIFPPLSD